MQYISCILHVRLLTFFARFYALIPERAWSSSCYPWLESKSYRKAPVKTKTHQFFCLVRPPDHPTKELSALVLRFSAPPQLSEPTEEEKKMHDNEIHRETAVQEGPKKNWCMMMLQHFMPGLFRCPTTQFLKPRSRFLLQVSLLVKKQRQKWRRLKEWRAKQSKKQETGIW